MTAGGVTPSQTVGPFFHQGLLRDQAQVLVGQDAPGRFRLEGQVRDGGGAPVSDALLEIWQANMHGRYRHPADGRDVPLDPHFLGWGRCGTDAAGRYWFETIKPGRVVAPAGGLQAPHLVVQVFARGLLDRLTTRVYFAHEASNAQDAVLAAVPEHRRATLLAARHADGAPPLYRWDIVLQGAAETVFFAIGGR